MKESLLQLIWHHLFGYHYYAVVSYRTGRFDIALCGHILPTRKEAKKLLQHNSSFSEFEIVSFWSRHRYVYDQEHGVTSLAEGQIVREE